MSVKQKKALLVIDLQNDYFPGGRYPLWNTEITLKNVETALKKASIQKIPVILIQHQAEPSQGIAPFFNPGTSGVDIHPRILQAAPDADIVIKAHADSFEQTDLEGILIEKNISELLICGMMTQNCVTHTAISKKAEPYTVTVLADCCTTVDEMIHQIALHALSSRVKVTASDLIL
jgi:nicotinamidase-related amidase